MDEIHEFARRPASVVAEPRVEGHYFTVIVNGRPSGGQVGLCSYSIRDSRSFGRLLQGCYAVRFFTACIPFGPWENMLSGRNTIAAEKIDVNV